MKIMENENLRDVGPQSSPAIIGLVTRRNTLMNVTRREGKYRSVI
jgi:hypothetical protein